MRRQIFFAELDVADASASGFDNFCEQGPSTRGFVAWKLSAIGDVVEQACGHQASAYYHRPVAHGRTRAERPRHIS